MKTLICYSSKTGNTRKLAHAIETVTPDEHDLKEIGPDDGIDPSGYDLLIIGYWVENSKADNNTLKFLKKVRDMKIILFGTCGTDREHPYVKSILNRTEKEIDRSNLLLGHYICRGEIYGKVIENFEALVKSTPGNKSLEIMLGLFKEQYPGSLGHPNDEDLYNAKAWFKNILATIE